MASTTPDPRTAPERPSSVFRRALLEESPLQIVGTVNANHALLARRAGYRAIYLSGGGVAAGSLGMPDLGINTLDDVLVDVRRITDACELPLLVDIDTGFGPSAFNIARTVKSLIKAGAAACHIEDQLGAKRCGHRPGKEVVPLGEMADRVRAAADARTDPGFFLIARTDAIAVDGVDAVPVPVLANITEFGATPLFTVDELRPCGVAMVLYPLSAFRAMNKAAEAVYQAIRRDGTQRGVVDAMQTREELYDRIGYHDFERRLDALAQARAGVREEPL
jgi:methylisocitrate lyase